MLERIWKKIIRRGSLSPWMIPAFFLWLLSFPFRLGVRIRGIISGPPVRVSLPVISVGNITVGGSGKTPLVGFITRDLLAAGIRVGIVSSGYGRSHSGSFVAPGYKVQEMAVTATGDEVMLLASVLPEAIFSVARQKVTAAQTLAQSGKVDVIIVDDGFQHFKLARDIDIVAYDAGLTRKMLKSFPYGMLREPFESLDRADVIIITRAKFAHDLGRLRKRLALFSPRADMYHAGFRAEMVIGRDRTLPVKYLEDKSVFLFAGVGNFRALKRQVTALAGDVDHAWEFSDHQVYDRPLLEEIKRMAARHESDLILTTLKDWVKVKDFDFGRETYYLDMAVDLDPGEEKLIHSLTERLGLAQTEN